MVFPIPGGLLQTAEFTQDLLSGEVVIAEGSDEFVDTISEFDLPTPTPGCSTSWPARAATPARA